MAELKIEEIEAILRSDCLKNLKTLSIGGGEPFLRGDFDEVAVLAHEILPNTIVTTTTNCLLPDVIYQKARSVLEHGVRLQVQLSLNGPEDIHDWSRGVKGNYKKVMQTLKLLQSLKNENLEISVSSFYFPQNIDYIPWLIEFKKEHGIPVGLSKLQIHRILSNEHLKHYLDDLHSLRDLESCLNLAHNTGLITTTQAYYEDMLLNRRKPHFKCLQGSKSIFIYQYGDVYPCTLQTPEMYLGNVRQNSLDEIYHSVRARRVLSSILRRSGDCNSCVNECFVIPYLCNDVSKVIRIRLWYKRKMALYNELIRKGKQRVQHLLSASGERSRSFLVFCFACAWSVCTREEAYSRFAEKPI